MAIVESVQDYNTTLNKKVLEIRADETPECNTIPCAAFGCDLQNTRINTNEIKLLSANPEFYKTFTHNNIQVSTYINVTSDPKQFYLILTANKNRYYIKMHVLDKIQNLEDFKQMLINDININLNNGNVAHLNIDLINKFVRDTPTDIIYNPNNTDTNNRNYPLFCFVDYKNNIFFAYNKMLVDTEIQNKFKYRDEYGCLFLLSNTKKSISYNIVDVNFTRLMSCLMDKVGYTF